MQRQWKVKVTLVVFIDLQPNASTDIFALKRKVVELFKSYRLMYKQSKQAQSCRKYWISKVFESSNEWVTSWFLVDLFNFFFKMRSTFCRTSRSLSSASSSVVDYFGVQLCSFEFFLVDEEEKRLRLAARSAQQLVRAVRRNEGNYSWRIDGLIYSSAEPLSVPLDESDWKCTISTDRPDWSNLWPSLSSDAQIRTISGLM